jgi:hypothetical protein
MAKHEKDGMGKHGGKAGGFGKKEHGFGAKLGKGHKGGGFGKHVESPAKGSKY